MYVRLTILLYLTYWSHCRPPEVAETIHLDFSDTPSLHLTDEYAEYGNRQEVTIPSNPVDMRPTNRTLHIIPAPTKAPEYMLHLYNKFSSQHAAYLDSNIVRSFVNINQERYEDNETKSGLGIMTRIQTMVFNVTAIQITEIINIALLRLYTLIQNDMKTYAGVAKKVSLYEVIQANNTHPARLIFIGSKDILSDESGWEVFDVTSSVQEWVKSSKKLHVLEIRIETIQLQGDLSDIDVNTTSYNNKNPIIVVFSNDFSLSSDIYESEREYMILHEQDSVAIESIANILYNDFPSMSTRRRREVSDFSVKLSMKNKSFPLKRKSRIKDKMFSRRVVSYTNSKTGRDKRNTDRWPKNIYARHRKNRGRKTRRLKRHKRFRRNICRKQAMYVNFEDINWHNWIIAPRGFQAYECVGRCFFPLDSHLSPTKHAVIQALMHAIHPRRLARACCVPTRLEPISILFIDNGVVTYKYKYDGMVVSECGCR